MAHLRSYSRGLNFLLSDLMLLLSDFQIYCPISRFIVRFEILLSELALLLSKMCLCYFSHLPTQKSCRETPPYSFYPLRFLIFNAILMPANSEMTASVIPSQFMWWT